MGKTAKTLNSSGGWSEKESLLLTSVWKSKPGRREALPRQWACNLSVMARVECTFPRPSHCGRLDEVRVSVLQAIVADRSTKHRGKVAGSMIMSFGNPNAVKTASMRDGFRGKGGNRLEGSQEKAIDANQPMGGAPRRYGLPLRPAPNNVMCVVTSHR